MFGDVYHVGYLTDDIDAAVAFYERTFGGTLKMQTTSRDGASRMAFVRVGQTEIELIEPNDKSRLGGRTGLIVDHVGYVVDSIDGEMTKLAERGIKFQTEAPYTNPEGARLIYLDSSTTQGARIHLTERPR